MLKVIIKKTVIISLLLLLGFGLGELYYSHSITSTKDDGIELPEIIQPEVNKIDSLVLEISRRDSIINYLKDRIHTIESTRIDKVDSIRELPMTDAVEFLRIKLREFDSKY